MSIINLKCERSETEGVWIIIKQFNDQLKNSLPEEFICKICKTILANAYQGPCGCKYCESCINPYFSQPSHFCPGTKPECTTSRGQVVIDYELNRNLKNIQVKCLKKSCDFKDKLCNIETHMKNCDRKFEDCPFYLIGGCIQTNISLDTMEHHLTSANFSHCKFLTRHIYSLNQNFEQLQKNQIQEMNKLNLDIMKNLEKTYEEIKEKIESLELVITYSREEARKTKQGLEILSQKLEEIETKIDIYRQNQDPVQGIRCFLEEYKNFRLEKEFYENLHLNNQIYEFQRILKKENEFIWIVENFKQKLDTAKSGQNENIYSPTFYSRKNGCKIQLRLMPNGYRNAKSKYLSVFFCLLKGEFDPMISWPIKDNVKINIIDQSTRKVHISHSFNYESASDEDKVLFNRPLLDDSPISFYGKYDFIELDEVFRNPFLTIDDKIIFTCLVSTN